MAMPVVRRRWTAREVRQLIVRPEIITETLEWHTTRTEPFTLNLIRYFA
jgi:hypothetical protein